MSLRTGCPSPAAFYQPFLHQRLSQLAGEGDDAGEVGGGGPIGVGPLSRGSGSCRQCSPRPKPPTTGIRRALSGRRRQCSGSGNRPGTRRCPDRRSRLPGCSEARSWGSPPQCKRTLPGSGPARSLPRSRPRRLAARSRRSGYRCGRWGRGGTVPPGDDPILLGGSNEAGCVGDVEKASRGDGVKGRAPPDGQREPFEQVQ